MITANKALKAVEAAEAKAKELGIAITTCVVNEHGTVIATLKMDGSLVVSPKFAYTKAYTSATLKFPTSALGAYSAPNKPYYGLTSLDGGRYTAIAGGLPIQEGDKVVGAVGVGGSADVSQDEECAKAAVAALA